MHHNVRSKGDSGQRMARAIASRTRMDRRGRQVKVYSLDALLPNNRSVVLIDPRTGLPCGSRFTMVNGVRVDCHGAPRSKTYSYRGRR